MTEPTIDTIITELREARAYTKEHYPKESPGKFVGRMKANEFYKGIDLLLDEIEGMRQALDDTGGVYMHIDCDDSDHVENERLRDEVDDLLAERLLLRERLSRFEETLTTIANQDYRGNRCSCSTLAYKALKAGVGE